MKGIGKLSDKTILKKLKFFTFLIGNNLLLFQKSLIVEE